MILCLAALLAQDALEIEHFSVRPPGHIGLAAESSEARLRVVVGGAAALGSDPFHRELLTTAGLSAAALSFDELDAANPEVLSGLPFVCANLVDKRTGKTLVRSHVVVRRTAFIGLLKPGRDAKPPDGWRIDDPSAALKSLLPALAQESDRIVVLAAMDRIEAAGLLKAHPEISAAIVPARGSNDAEALKVGEAWLVQSPDGSGVVGRLALPEGKNALVRVELSKRDSERLASLGAKHGRGGDRFVTKSRPTGGLEEGPATSFEPGKTKALWAEAKNRALEVRVHSFLVTPEHAGKKAADGRAWLVVDSEWTNAIPMQYVFERETPVEFHIGDFREILFVVANGSRLGRLNAELTSGPGGLTEKDFKLPYLGSSRRGVAVLDVPASIESLDLRFYDFSHGHMAIPMLAKKDAPASRPIATAENGILEVEVWSVKRDRGLVRVEMRARSVWPYEVDATAFDAEARKGQKMKVPSLGRWEDVSKLVSIVADGETAVPPAEAADTILLPDAATGAELVFAAPESARSLELRLDFVKIGVPGRSDPVLPKPLTIPLEGTRPKAIERKPLATVRAESVRIDVVGKSGRTLELSILNEGEGRLFDAREELKVDGGDLPESVVAPRFLPKGERRVFQVEGRKLTFGDQTVEVP